MVSGKTVSFVVVAAGSGSRFGGDKVKIEVFGRPVLSYLFYTLSGIEEIDEIVVATRKELIPFVEKNLKNLNKPFLVVEGGESREDSVYEAVKRTKGDLLLIHDGARPLLTRGLVMRVLDALKDHPSVVPGVPERDTLRWVIKEGALGDVVKRDRVIRIQTPQGFWREVILNGLKKAGKKRRRYTDDATLVRDMIGVKTNFVGGDERNIKITYKEDLELVERLLLREIRVGFGFDRHRLIEGRPLVIGGVKIPYKKGALGHSDGDVVIHSLVDALLGATGLGNIGQHFPDTDPRFEGKDSLYFLEEAMNMVRENGFLVLSADTTVLLEEPKLTDYLEEMRVRISRFLDVDPTKVSIKPKRGEGLDSVGKGMAVEAYSVIMVVKGGLDDSN